MRVVTPRRQKRVLALVFIACALLAAGAVCAYVFLGWLAFFNGVGGHFAGMGFPERRWDPTEAEAARALVAETRWWARASRYAAIAFAGDAVGTAMVAAWQSRLSWRSWPWPSLVSFVPALFALSITVLGAAKGVALNARARARRARRARAEKKKKVVLAAQTWVPG